MVDSTHQPSHSDEKKEDSHGNDSSDDMDAGHQTQALTPRSNSNEQQAYQLQDIEKQDTSQNSSVQHSQRPYRAPRTKTNKQRELSYVKMRERRC